MDLVAARLERKIVERVRKREPRVHVPLDRRVDPPAHGTQPVVGAELRIGRAERLDEAMIEEKEARQSEVGQTRGAAAENRERMMQLEVERSALVAGVNADRIAAHTAFAANEELLARRQEIVVGMLEAQVAARRPSAAQVVRAAQRATP